MKDDLSGPAFEMPDDNTSRVSVDMRPGIALLPITRTGMLPFDAVWATTPAIRRVHLSGGRVVDVRVDGHYTFYRHAHDTAEAALSPYAGRWILASPEFRAEIERAA